jgi:AmmeMemoRadiSam system protein B
MELDTDEDEHSIEMHLPYIRKVFEGCVFQHCLHLPMAYSFMFRKDISIVPILVGAIDKTKEETFGRILAPYFASEDTFFVISSDFCHWGTRFSYTFYFSQSPSEITTPIRLSRSTTSPHDLTTFPIHESISALDHEAMELITLPPSTAHQAHVFFADYLTRTKNTICGRHPIGVLLGALAVLQDEHAKSPHLQWVKYEQSSRCLTIKDSSVSYASAYVTF